MKPMKLLIAVGVLAILGGLVYYTEQNPPAPDDDRVAVIELEEPAIQAVTIHRPDKDPLRIERAGEEDWRFGEPVAAIRVDGFAVQTLVSQFTPLNAERVIEETVEDWSPYGLGGEGTLKAVVETEGGQTYELILGRDTPTGSGVYARLAGDPRLFLVYSFIKSGLDKEPFDLRDKKLVDVDANTISRVVLKTGQQSIEFGKAGENRWQILQPKPLRADNFTVGDLVRSVQNAEMATVLSEGEEPSASYPFTRPYAVVEVTDESGAHTLTAAQSGDSAYYARSSDLTGVYEVSSTFAEGLNKQLDEFRNKKLFDFGFEDPLRLRLRDGDTEVVIAKKEDQWVAESDGGRQLSAERVQAVIDSLRNLTSIAFASDEAPAQAGYGLSEPDIELEVTPAPEGSEPERVVVSSPEEDRVYAAIPGLPTTYELEKSAVEQIQRSIEELLEPAEGAEPEAPADN